MKRVEIKVIVFTDYEDSDLETATTKALSELPGIQGIVSFDAKILCEHNNVSEYFEKCDDCGADLSAEMAGSVACEDCGAKAGEECEPTCHQVTDHGVDDAERSYGPRQAKFFREIAQTAAGEPAVMRSAAVRNPCQIKPLGE